MIRLETCTGAGVLPHLPALSRLRAEVFAEWPYLYDADPAEESEHLRRYAEGEGAAVILALDGAEAVGAATCQPMSQAATAVRGAFEAAGRDPGRHCYFGESVLRREFRGQGLGVAFLAAREAVARAHGLATAAFCAVERDPADPRRPAGHVPLDGFWRRRGYVNHPALVCCFAWPEIGGTGPVPHRLSFWLKALA
ncbi:MAG TPA: GNAT family N-acetyltransferase [Roseococcus sp.]|nr:GNAT family N-acetyltransferase [Roseococcus sp.]